MKKDYDYYLTCWFAGVRAHIDIEYDKPASVRKANRGTDKYRKAAQNIGLLFPEKIENFADLMNHKEEEIRVCAAVSIVELMPHSKNQLDRAKSVILDRMNHCQPAEIMGWEWWMKQPWASDSNL